MKTLKGSGLLEKRLCFCAFVPNTASHNRPPVEPKRVTLKTVVLHNNVGSFWTISFQVCTFKLLVKNAVSLVDKADPKRVRAQQALVDLNRCGPFLTPSVMPDFVGD